MLKEQFKNEKTYQRVDSFHIINMSAKTNLPLHYLFLY